MPVRPRLPLLVLAAALAAGSSCTADHERPPGAWQRLEEGLEFGEFELPVGSPGGPTLHVLRIDPARYELKLFMASAEPDGQPRSAAAWVREKALIAAINAGLYQQDGRTSVSLMRSREHVNNGHVAAAHQAVLAFDPADPQLPLVQIIDREHQPLDVFMTRYGSLVQGIRMIALDRRNVWRQQEQRHDTAAIAVDEFGRALLLYNDAPMTTHDLVEGLLRLPLDLRNAMYLEGGPKAQLFLDAGGRRLTFGGLGGDGGADAVPIPNVIGIAHRNTN